MRTRLISVLSSAAVLLSACGGTPAADPNPTDSTSASNAAAASLPARWWTWTESFDPAENPIDDATGDSCAENQPSDVWFLAGSHGGSKTRSCRIPAGRSIYFPVINQICTASPGDDDDSAVDACSGAADHAEASLDGEPLQIVEADSGGIFPFEVQSDSSTGFEAGPTQAVAWGLWVGPVELTDGEHTLRFEASSGTFELDITYKLDVG